MKKFLALMLATIVLMIGCGNEQSEKPAKQVTIAMLSIANDEGIARAWYDEQLGKELGAKVIKLDYDSGMLANEAMATGNIDIALVGSTAAALGISKGLPYQVFWIHSIDGDNEALAVKNNSGINSLADLKGKRVGVPPASTAQYSLHYAMKSVGLYDDSVMIIELQPSTIIDAWKENKIDAAFVWQPYLDELLEDGRVLLSSRELNADGITTADVGVVNKEFARRHPDILEKYIELQIKAHELYRAHPKQAVELAAANLITTPEYVWRQMNEIIWLDLEQQLSENYIGTVEWKGQLVQMLIDTAKFLERNGNIEKAASDETFEAAVNPAAAEAVSKK